MYYIKVQPHILTVENGTEMTSGVTLRCTITKTSGSSSSTQTVSLSIGSYTEANFTADAASISFTGTGVDSTHLLKRISCVAKMKFGNEYVACIGKNAESSPLDAISITEYLANATTSGDALVIDVYYYLVSKTKEIRFNTNGGTSATPSPITFTLGATTPITLPARPTKTSGSSTVTASGWCIPGVKTMYTTSISSPQNVLTGNVTMFAMWSATDWTSDTFIDSLVYKAI